MIWFHFEKSITFEGAAAEFDEYILSFQSEFSSTPFSFLYHTMQKMKKQRMVRGHREQSVLLTLSELQDLRGKINKGTLV